jgi:hypothetical protein
MDTIFTKQWLKKLNFDGENVILYHYGPSGLTEIDPKFWGKNYWTPKRNAITSDVSYYYVNPKDREKDTMGIGGELYEVEVPIDKLYPFNKDPLDFYSLAEEEYGGNLSSVYHQFVYMRDIAKKQGYVGFIAKWEGTLIGLVWEKLPVKKEIKEDFIPSNDFLGYPIIDGLSSDKNLVNRNDKMRRVISTLKRNGVSNENIINYTKKIKLEEKLVLKGESWDKYIKIVAKAYKDAPDFEQSEVWRWDKLRDSNYVLWKRLLSKVDIIFVSNDVAYKDNTKDIKILEKDYKIEYLENQPYETAEEMKKDYIDNGVLKISIDYSVHPIFTVVDNIIFRTVHDFIVHILTDTDFSGYGEIKAYNSHAKLLPPDARPAAFTEVVGQASYFLTYGEFPKQKITILDGFDFLEVGKVKDYKVIDKELISNLSESILDTISILETKLMEIENRKDKREFNMVIEKLTKLVVSDISEIEWLDIKNSFQCENKYISDIILNID